MSVLCVLGSIGLMAVCLMTLAIPGASLIAAIGAFMALGFAILFSHIEGRR